MRESTVAIVKATAPVLQQTAVQITTRFYEILFSEHPEVQRFFSRAHQANGTQPRALAGAIVAFARYIEEPQALSEALWRVANKHASLLVEPAHYPIVGACLLRAIADVLGDAATDEILDAWGEAYEYLSHLLIDIEEYIYQIREGESGGWRGTRRFRVARREDESATITSFYLVPVDRGPLPAFRAGQYITIQLTIDGEEVRRSYSLSSAPGAEHLRVSIKREPYGLVSTYFHECVFEGHDLDIMPPCGDFVLDQSDAPLVLLSAGVGVTPCISMLDQAVASGREIVFLHAARNRAVHAFRAHVEELAARHPQVRHAFVYDQPDPGDAPQHTGRIDTELLDRYLPAARASCEVYFLGPKPFMESIYQATLSLGVPRDKLHFEFFGPHQELTAPATETRPAAACA